MAEYKLMYLKQLKLVTKAARPSLICVSHGFIPRIQSYLLDDLHNAADIEYS